MNKFIQTIIIIVFLSGLRPALTADEILIAVDTAVNSPPDQVMTMELKIIDKKGFEQNLEIIMQQKGADRRTGKFLAPAEKKGIAFLSLPDGVMYLYLPAYKKTRRIASHIKNTKFAGTDCTYEDMEAVKYSEKWRPSLLSNNDEQWVLELTPKSGDGSEYSKIIMTVNKVNFYPLNIEYFDQGGKQCKIMNREQIEKVDGYWVAGRSELSDLRSGNRTIMEVKSVAFNTGLSDELFTERYLER